MREYQGEERVDERLAQRLPRDVRVPPLRVAAAGKACVVEKPMARNFVESQAMARAFEAAGVPLFVAFYRRAYPRILRLRRLLDERAVGTVREVRYTFTAPHNAHAGWRHEAPSSGGGLFVDVGALGLT